LLLGLAWLSLPLLFVHQAGSPLDKHIGEYSYPVYIGHAFVLWWINYVGWFAGSPVLHSLANVVAALLLAALLKRVVIDRVEGLRDQYRRPNEPPAPIAPSPAAAADPVASPAFLERGR
jgi:peptidoglycan/LPS O-acetylase OafA/YrhL